MSISKHPVGEAVDINLEDILDSSGHFPVSASRYKASDCLYYLFMKYILMAEPKWKGGGGPVAGNYSHDVMYQYAKLLKDTKTEADIELFEEIVNKVREAFPKLSQKDFDAVYRGLLKTAEKLEIHYDYLLEPEQKIALTWDLEKCDWDSKDAWLKMVIDLMFYDPDNPEAIEIIDFKSQPGVPSDTHLKNDIQVNLYPWGMQAWNQNLKTLHVTFIYTRYAVFKGFKFSAFDLSAIEDRMRKFSEYITKKLYSEKPIEEEWPAKSSRMCPYCAYDCPLMEKGVVIVNAKADVKEIARRCREMYHQKKRIEKEISRIQEYLSSWSTANEESEIAIDQGSYGFFKSNAYRFDVPGVIEYAMDKGVPVEHFMKVDKEKLLKLEDEEIRNMILDPKSGLVKIIEGTKFKFKEKEKE
jgi:hypothetical protein